MSKQIPKVVIGIATKNRSEKLLNCIKSINQLSYSNLLVKVFCDGCTDDTVVKLKDFPFVIVYDNTTSIGYKAARNKLMQPLDFDYFITLDDDTFFIDDQCIVNAINYLEFNKRVGILSLDILDKAEDALLNKKINPFKISEFIGCGNVIRKQVLEDCGFYNLHNKPYGGEEQELSLNCSKKGWEIYYLPQAFIVHDEAKQNRSYIHQWKSRTFNALYIVQFYYPPFIWPFFFILKINAHLLFGIRSNMFLETFATVIEYFKTKKKMPSPYLGRLSNKEILSFLKLKRHEINMKRSLRMT